MGCVEALDTTEREGGPGDGVRPAEPTGAQGPGGSESEVGLVFLQLHHEVMDVDELRPGRERAQLGLGQHPVEAVVQLDQLRQRPLQGRVGQTRGDRTVSFSPGEEQGNRQDWARAKAGVAGHLDDAGSIPKVGKAPHDILTQGLH